MIVRFPCKDKRLKNSTIRAVKKIYQNKIKKPIHISFRDGMKKNTGTHALETIDRYKNIPKELDNDDVATIKEIHNGRFHIIQLSTIDFMETHYGLREKVIPIPWKDIFSKHRIMYDPQLCWFSHILTHELRHAWQTDLILTEDDTNFRYQHSYVNKRKKKGLSKWAHENVWEYDAEVFAKENSNKMFSMIKKGFKDG
jgi:hypothetical protein